MAQPDVRVGQETILHSPGRPRHLLAGKRLPVRRKPTRRRAGAALETALERRPGLLRDGADRLVGDVAEIRLDHYELSRVSYTDGDPVIGLSVRRQAGSNVIEKKVTGADFNATIGHAMGVPHELVREINISDGPVGELKAKGEPFPRSQG